LNATCGVTGQSTERIGLTNICLDVHVRNGRGIKVGDNYHR